MPRCDASRYALTVHLPAKLKGVVDLKDHKGLDARAVLDVLVSEGCKLETKVLDDDEVGSDPEAVWDGESFTFYNFLSNTNEAGSKFSLPLVDIVKAIDRKVLTGVTTPNGHYRLVVRDERHDNCDVATLKTVIASHEPKKYRGRGLKRMVSMAISEGLLPSQFCVKDVERVLLSKNWRVGNHYSNKSILSALCDLVDEGLLILQKDGMVKNRVWGIVGSTPSVNQVASTVAPSPSTVGGRVDQIVHELAGEIAERARRMAKEMLGI